MLFGRLDAHVGVDEWVALVVEQVLVGIVLADVAVVPGADAPEVAHHVAVAEHPLGGEELGQLVALAPGAGRSQLPAVLVAELLLVRRVFREVPAVDPDLGVAVVADRAGLAAVLVEHVVGFRRRHAAFGVGEVGAVLLDPFAERRDAVGLRQIAHGRIAEGVDVIGGGAGGDVLDHLVELLFRRDGDELELDPGLGLPDRLQRWPRPAARHW